MARPILELDGFTVRFSTRDEVVHAVDAVSLVVEAGQTLGLVGESGSGKSATALGVMRLLPEAVAQTAGRTAYLGTDLQALPLSEMSQVRGREIAMVFQEHMTSLNPVYRVGDQIAESIVRHQKTSRTDARARAAVLLEEVGIDEPEVHARRYPHQLSGGQRQRVLIAMALANDPTLLIADEPTTALDVLTQARLLTLLRRLVAERGMTMLFVSHDLGVIREIADQVAVMHEGRIVEVGPTEAVLSAPTHAYTKRLLACLPRLDAPAPVADSALRPLLSVRGLKVRYPAARDWMGRPSSWLAAVDGVSFDIQRGRALGLVGASGCGKTTLGRAILRLVDPAGGSILFRDGETEVDLATLSQAELTPMRRRLQMVFQDPAAALDPRQTIEQALIEVMEVHQLEGDREGRRLRARELLCEVGLEGSHLARYPHELSGGQKQRACIARCLAVRPSLIVCDEPVSALDVSVQAQVLELLQDLQATHGLTYLFISHDLAVVKSLCHQVCVMQDGRFVETGDTNALYAAPSHPHTRELLAAVPGEPHEAHPA